MEKRNIAVRPYKIMIVDDDPFIIRSLEKILFRENYLFFSVTSGEKVFKNIEQLAPDMILLDVFMKGLSGFEVCQQLKDEGITQKIPVIFLTSNNDSGEIVKGFKAGAVDYIFKPFNAEELLARIKTHLELKKAREDIKQINQIRSKFFSIITHDIKDALIGVKGVSEFLNEELSHNNIEVDEIRKMAKVLQEDSKALFDFVNDLIKWGDIEVSQEAPKNQRVSFYTAVNQLIDEYNPVIKDKNIDIQTDITDNIILHTDQAILKEILAEILKNAVKYSYENGKINIGAVKNDNKTKLWIKDHGVGMEKQVKDNLFRLDSPHPKTIGTKNEKGIGLGLIICHALIKKIKGKITIESERKKGAKVWLTIPDME